MFSTNWVSRSPHRALRRTSTGTYTHRRALVHRRGVPTALLLTQPRLVRSPCDASSSRHRASYPPIYTRDVSLPCTLKARVTLGARDPPLLLSLFLFRSPPFSPRNARALRLQATRLRRLCGRRSGESKKKALRSDTRRRRRRRATKRLTSPSQDRSLSRSLVVRRRPLHISAIARDPLVVLAPSLFFHSQRR